MTRDSSPSPSATTSTMSLAEASRVLGISGYPTTAFVSALHLGPRDAPDGPARWIAFDVVHAFLAELRRGSPELQRMFEEIPWGAGSTTEAQGLRAYLAAYGSLEMREAERRERSGEG